jgi:hypothetical protein
LPSARQFAHKIKAGASSLYPKQELSSSTPTATRFALSLAKLHGLMSGKSEAADEPTGQHYGRQA